jgi:hypothetical protein
MAWGTPARSRQVVFEFEIQYQLKSGDVKAFRRQSYSP